MKLTYLKTYWDADDAYAILSLLDELRDVLWATYADEIIERQKVLAQNHSTRDDAFDSELESEFDSFIDDDIPY